MVLNSLAIHHKFGGICIIISDHKRQAIVIAAIKVNLVFEAYIIDVPVTFKALEVATHLGCCKTIILGDALLVTEKLLPANTYLSIIRHFLIGSSF